MPSLNDIKVTVFQNILAKTGVVKPFLEVVEEIETDKLGSLAKKGKELYGTPEYADFKKTIPGFRIGVFSGQRDADCTEYSPCMGFDIDNCTDENEAKDFIGQLAAMQDVCAAYLSPSAHGVRFFVHTTATVQTHKEVYLSVCKEFSKRLGIGTAKSETAYLDAVCSNVGRIWYYTGTEVYTNENARTFKMPTVAAPSYPTITADMRMAVVEHQLSRQPDKGRNNACFHLAVLMREHGFSENETLAHCLKMEDNAHPAFPRYEIEKTVNSAIKHAMFNKYADGQIIAYMRKAGLWESTTASQRTNADDQAITEKKEKEEHEEGDDTGDNKFKRIKKYLSDKYEFRLNLIANDIEVLQKNNKNQSWRVINENDLLCELYDRGFTGIDKLLAALLASKFVEEYNPFKNYLEGLPTWKEGDKDYITYLASFVKVKPENRDWFDLMFKKHLVRSLACALNVIPFNKHCFTLHGKQNDGKTSFLRFLCPTELIDYIKEDLDIHNKDGRLALCQNLYINLDELSALSRYEISKIKSFFTIDNVKERLPYGKKPVRISRTASFMASTNESEFLTDPTGNVRWLVFEIDGIQHDDGGAKGYNALVDINKVYAQAHHLLRSGYKYQLTAAELKQSEARNAGHIVHTDETEAIAKFFVPTKESETGAKFMTAFEISDWLQVHTSMKTNNIKVGKSLGILGFERTQHFLRIGITKLKATG